MHRKNFPYMLIMLRQHFIFLATDGASGSHVAAACHVINKVPASVITVCRLLQASGGITETHKKSY